MKALSLFVSAFFTIIILHAQDYQISFSGSGQSTTVDSIQVENLSQGTSLSLQGADVLHLVGTLGIHSLTDHSSSLKIYPNPMIISTSIDFVQSENQYVFLEIFDDKGASIARNSMHLDAGWQRFEVSGLNTGIYLVSVRTSNRKYSAKLISLGKTPGNAAIKYTGMGGPSGTQINLKSTNDIIQMQYNDGELLLFKGFSGNYTRILTTVPTQSQTVDFEFISCSDQDGNNYATVSIGAQSWMGENLKTTKFNDGINIPNVSDSAEWANLTTPGYVWYENNQNNYGQIYGALYNWFTVNTGKLCPAGWHVPTDSEWEFLINSLGGFAVAGGKLKETGTLHWPGPNTEATNETGFTGLPGGSRGASGHFHQVQETAYWWSSTESSSTWALLRFMVANHGSMNNYDLPKTNGFSIRCIQD